MSWEPIVAAGGIVVAMTGVFAFLWKINNSFRDKTDSLQKDFAQQTASLRNDVAWVNQDLGTVKKDVEWLVWFLKEGPKSDD